MQGNAENAERKKCRCLPFIVFFFKTISNKKQLLDSVFAL